jgi:hypothetical protein
MFSLIVGAYIKGNVRATRESKEDAAESQAPRLQASRKRGARLLDGD